MITNESETEVTRLRAIADKTTSFEACVREFQRAEKMSQGKAIDAAAKYKPDAYNSWRKSGSPAIQFVGR